MSQTFLSPDRLYDRHWRPGHPFRRNPSAKRRWTMLLLFAFLCALIGGYLYITDPSRVKQLAESELTRIIGGHVTVGKAKLSLFEGLRLEYVNVYVDRGGADDSLLFSANQFFVDYDAKALLAGKLRLTRIAAIDPTVQLIENLDTGKWNYQRMRRAVGRPPGIMQAPGATTRSPQAVQPLPQAVEHEVAGRARRGPRGQAGRGVALGPSLRVRGLPVGLAERDALPGQVDGNGAVVCNCH